MAGCCEQRSNCDPNPKRKLNRHSHPTQGLQGERGLRGSVNEIDELKLATMHAQSSLTMAQEEALPNTSNPNTNPNPNTSKS